MTIHTEWYRIFMYAAQFGNLTKAGQMLHMTQPSVSYAIKQLEEALGMTLFDRLSKGVRLTQEGQLLFEHVKLAFAHLDTGEKQMRQLKQFKDGQVRIGANGAIIKDILLPKLDLFHQSYPDIHVRLIQNRTSLIVQHLKEGKLDIGFIHLPLDDSELAIKYTAPLRNCFVVGARYRELAEYVVTTAQLLTIPLLLLSAGSRTRSFVEQWFSRQGYTIDADIELNSLEMLAVFAERGYGAAFVPRSYVEAELARGVLFELHTEVPIDDRQFGIATRRDLTLSLPTAKFLELFQHEA
ncbi:LysR family transcriptional regulator [Paenibacillus sp. GCM10027626]|uniref:LysR family transcriptional regulator n=1 Tax=Paenibacillus sp. GCM10027626 TaxID=3273411 RepID=UPI003639BB8E